MFKKIKNFFKTKKQKGQSMIFFAATVPIIGLFVGAAMDFGWLYYNQSRLQNAADSAASVGAKTLIGVRKGKEKGTDLTDTPLSEYEVTSLVSNSDLGLKSMQDQSIISKRSKVYYDKNTKQPAGDPAAKIYAETNLRSWIVKSQGNQQEVKNIKLIEDDNIGRDSNGNENVKFESTLWGPNVDDEDSLYYTVTLTTKLDHLFGGIMDTFGIGQLPSKATAAVKIAYGTAGQSLFLQMKKKEKSSTYSNWEEIRDGQGGNGPANDRSVLTAGTYFNKNNLNRVEASVLNGDSFGSSGGNQKLSKSDMQFKFDDLFIDFQGEMDSGSLSKDKNYDLENDLTKLSGGWKYGDQLSSDIKKRYELSYRIHFPVMIIEKYHVRDDIEKYGVVKDPPDPLYAFIEQETILTNSVSGRGNMNSVRQIIINNDVANTDVKNDRPWVFFYEGPELPYSPSEPDPELADEKNMTSDEWIELFEKQKKQANKKSAYYDEDGDYIGEYSSEFKTVVANRPLLPVILNLYADFRGILFIPNNPVVINGNGHKFEGFVVAREFRRLKTWKDFQSATYIGGSDDKKPVYVYSPSYKGKEAPFYAQVSNWKEKGTSSPSGYTKTRINFHGTWHDGWVKDGQYYTTNELKDPREYAQIEYTDNQGKVQNNRYAKFADLLLEVNLDSNNEISSTGKTYVAQYDGRYYTPIHEEKVILTSTNCLGNVTIGNDIFTSEGKTLTQKVNTMYISGTRYLYTETYFSTEGKEKTKKTIMNIGDVQFVNVTASDASIDENGKITGNYTETPRNHDTFADDDKLRFDYVNVFNLNAKSTYNSFKNVLLRNYVYLKKTEKSNLDSHDMFFTTVRAKHIN